MGSSAFCFFLRRNCWSSLHHSLHGSDNRNGEPGWNVLLVWWCFFLAWTENREGWMALRKGKPPVQRWHLHRLLWSLLPLVPPATAIRPPGYPDGSMPRRLKNVPLLSYSRSHGTWERDDSPHLMWTCSSLEQFPMNNFLTFHRTEMILPLGG